MIHDRRGKICSAVVLAALCVPLTVSQSHAGGVNIIYPPKLASAFDRPEVKSTAGQSKVAVSVAVQVNVVSRNNYRRAAIRRALGHRYLGFIKMYSGPRYPF